MLLAAALHASWNALVKSSSDRLAMMCLVNLVPAFLGVQLRTYVAATFIGIIPGSFVFAQVGTGLGSLLNSCETFSVSGILTPDIIAALVGLALLSLLPVAYKKYRARKGEG